MEEILALTEPTYYMDCREFKNGTVEMALKVVRPLHAAMLTSAVDELSYAAECKRLGESSSLSTKVSSPGVEKLVDEDKKQQNHLRAVRRSKQNIRFLLQEMQADRLLTLTYRENMQDRDRLNADLKQFIRNVRFGWAGQKGYPDWQYVAVTEVQERGALHVHLGVKGWQRITFLRSAWIRALGGKGYERGAEMPGNVDITSPKKARWGTQSKEWGATKLAAYMTKYLVKTFADRESGKKRYSHSRGFKVPLKARFFFHSETLVDAIQSAFRVIELHYGKLVDFSKSWLSPDKTYLWCSLT